MGIQINGNTDIISSTDGSLSIQGADLSSSSVTNLNVSGVTTVATLNATSIVGVTSAGITTVYANSINGGPLGGSRNIIINGSMVVNQRGFTGAAGTSIDAAYTTDRFVLGLSHDGVVSAGQTTLTSTTGGSAYADGFQNALILRVATADSSLAAAQYQLIQQYVEGYNLQGIKKGTANAQPVTLSFWVRSTTTGTYISELVEVDTPGVRQVSQAYTINAANTWEKKVITFPADTTGPFDNDNNRSLQVNWWLAAGSNFTSGTLNTSWVAQTGANRAVGQTNLLATAGNNFFLTGVQLEVGDRATEFERRSYGQELALCQRYYISLTMADSETIASGPSISSNRYRFLLPTPVTMRALPTVSYTGTLSFRTGGADQTISSMSALTLNPNGIIVGGAAGTIANGLSGSMYAIGTSTITLGIEL
jgi:hypothetical protein